MNRPLRNVVATEGLNIAETAHLFAMLRKKR
jgi:hypothetical protein